jgi:hypothetical protein
MHSLFSLEPRPTAAAAGKRVEASLPRKFRLFHDVDPTVLRRRDPAGSRARRSHTLHPRRRRFAAPGCARAEHDVQDQQRNADVDRRIGEIEDEEVPIEQVQVEIIDDRAMRQSVERVAERAADDRPEAAGGEV